LGIGWPASFGATQTMPTRGAAARNLGAAVSGLVDAANQAGGTDNITVLALPCLANGA
jgi:hypothetical protein